MVRSIGSGMSLEEFGRHIVEFVRAHESWAVPLLLLWHSSNRWHLRR